MLKGIGGESGKAMNEEVQKVYMRSICGGLLTEQLLSKMTWTGKTNKKDVKKIAFKEQKKITELIFGLAAAADSTIDRTLGKRLIIYEVLKYAYRKAGDVIVDASDNSSQSTNAASTTNIIVSTSTANPIQNSPAYSTANGSEIQQNPPDGSNYYQHYRPEPLPMPYFDPAYQHYQTIPQLPQPLQQQLPYQPYQYQPYQNPVPVGPPHPNSMPAGPSSLSAPPTQPPKPSPPTQPSPTYQQL